MTGPHRPTGGEPRRRTTGIHAVVTDVPYEQHLAGAALSTTTLGPRSRTTRQLEAIPEEAPKRRGWVLPALALGAVCLAALVYASPGSATTLPAQVRGTWAASEPAYADARLILSANAVQQYVGSIPVGPPARILDVRSVQHADTFSIVIRHRVEDGGSAELVMAYVASEPEVLMLRNPSGVAWHRADALTRK